MFNRTQYVIQETLKSRIMLTETYAVKDVNGYLLGYIKNRKLKSDFWFEGTDGTRLGEVHVVSRQKILVDRYEVYDAQKRFLATIRPRKSECRIEDPQGQQLAVGRRSSKKFERDKYQILAPDGGIIAKIHPKSDLLLRSSYSIDILRRGLDHLLILSYAHINRPTYSAR